MLQAMGNFLILLKLRIGVAMVLTAMASLAIVPGPTPPLSQIILLCLAVLISAGAAGGLNHYWDRDIDARMERTKNRPFVTGAVPHSRWWLLVLGVMTAVPVTAVAWKINAAAAFHVFMGAFFYGVVYTVWLKRRSWANIVIGGLAGSFAVLAGATTVDPTISPLALSLAAVLFLWTPSHFWSLAIALKDQYQEAGVPMLPVVVGEARAARVIFANTALLVAVSFSPLLYGLHWIYFLGALTAGGYFLAISGKLLQNPSREMAMVNFRASLIQLALLLFCAVLDSRLLG